MTASGMACFDSVCRMACVRDDIRVLVHGGAWDIPESLRELHRLGVVRAYEHALALYDAGNDPLDIVAAVLGVMEDDPVFDAGTGSFLNEYGNVELDAAVMEGASLRAGAVACLGSFPNPAEVALAVLRRTDHVLLVGSGAEAFARENGFRSVDPMLLVHDRERAAHNTWVAAGKPSAKIFFSRPQSESLAGAQPDRRGTVGVVLGVRRSDGNFSLFAGTSTGGTPGKKAGRVGDVPLVGCGLYADDETVAVSCTGWGEGLIRVAAAKAVSERVRTGLHPQNAVESVLAELWRRTEGRAGLIAIDAQGRTGAAFTTPDMAFAGSDCRPLFVG